MELATEALDHFTDRCLSLQQPQAPQQFPSSAGVPGPGSQQRWHQPTPDALDGGLQAAGYGLQPGGDYDQFLRSILPKNPAVAEQQAGGHRGVPSNGASMQNVYGALPSPSGTFEGLGKGLQRATQGKVIA